MMRKAIVEEIYILKKQHGPKTINGRLENVLWSLAIVENAYRDKFGNTCPIPFNRWLTGGSKGLAHNDYRQKYLDWLHAPLKGIKKVEEVNKCRDRYYGDKLAKGLITPFTEADLKRRSFSPKVRTWWDEKFKGTELVFQPKSENQMEFSVWLDWLTVENGVQLGTNPESLFIMKENKRLIESKLTMAGFTPLEQDAIFMHYESLSDGRGSLKEIQKHLNITRGTFQYLLKRFDRFLDECAVS